MTASITPAFCADAFSLTPDPQRLFLGRDHAEALAGLKLGLEYRRGLMVVVGEVGMGKTTVAYSLLATLGDGIRTAYIANTRVPFDGLLQHALEDFGVPNAERDRAGLLSALRSFLLDCAERNQIAVLVVDEAQSLDDETFENLRLLSNVETYRQKLLQIVLLGQPELDIRLRQPQLRQIADRVGVRVNINPLGRAESERYIAHRLEGAGGSIEMFSSAALHFIVRRTRGVPRRINIVCHNALLLAYAAGASQVTHAMAREAARELAGGSLQLLNRRPARPATRPGSRHVVTRSWAVAGALVVVTGMLLATGIERPAATPDGRAAAVPWTPPVNAVEAGREAPAADPVTPPIADAPAVAETPPPAAGTPEPAPGAPDPDRPSGREILVERGTTLLAIARQVYGYDSPDLIRRILQANPTVTNPNVIVAGSTILLPPEPASTAPSTGANDKKGS